MAKSMFLLLKSNNHGKMVKAKINDGCVIIEGKQFVIDSSSPIMLEKGMGVTPLYILKWSSTVPSTNINKKDGVQYVDEFNIPAERKKPQFQDKYDMTPEMLRKIMGMKILGNMIKTNKTRDLTGILMILGVAVAIALIVFGLNYTGILKLW